MRNVQRLLKTLRKKYNDLSTARMKGTPVDDATLLKVHADIEETERALEVVNVGLCGKFSSPKPVLSKSKFGF